MSEPCEMMSALKGKGRYIRLVWPEDITTREITYVIELVDIQMKTFRRIAQLREAGIKALGDHEWNSWFPEGHSARITLPDTSEGLR